MKNPTTSLSRRSFLALTGAAAFSSTSRAATGDTGILGQGDFRYRAVPGWGVLDAKTPVKNCHGMVTDKAGNLILLTDDITNNFIVYDPSGKLLHKWGTSYESAHGLSLVEENGKEILYFTDRDANRVLKSTTDGEILNEWGWPEQSGKYKEPKQYRPAWTLHLPNGDFIVLDGYGMDFLIHYKANGDYSGISGGNDGGIPHHGPHGGMVDIRPDGSLNLLIAMSDQQNLYRLDADGKKIAEIPLPGGNPRQIEKKGEHYFVPHLADNWPENYDSPGYVSILDKDFKVVSNVGGSPPVYDDEGKLMKMKTTSDTFIHPHDLTIGHDESLYVAQYQSLNTYPIKLERV